MEDRKLLNQSVAALRKLYNEGVNISSYLRENYGINNTPEIIELAYDIQAGTYSELVEKDEKVKRLYKGASGELAEMIKKYLSNPTSILEAGIGEGNFLAELLGNFDSQIESFGFDISWSRVAFSRMWLNQKGYDNVSLFTGDLTNIPCGNGAFDVVYTSHALEPNRGNEEVIIKELYRVANKYLVLREPIYEYADDEVKKRMDYHGYIKGLENIINSLGCEISENIPSKYISPLNHTRLIVIKKQHEIHEMGEGDKLVCPQTKTKLEKIDGAFFSPESLRVYPIINGIPCLRIENGIIASKYAMFAQS